MKFYSSAICWPSSNIFKLLLMVKLVIVLLITSLLQVSASTFSQTVTLNFKNAKLETVLKEIGAQTGYDLVYLTPVIKEAKPVSITVSNAPLDEVLEKSFSNQSLTYTISNHTIIVQRRSSGLMHTPLVDLNNLVGKASFDEVKGRVVDIRGRVTDLKGEPLIGVSVKVKGTAIGVSTDINGDYSIAVPDGSTMLVFTYIGFVAKEVSVIGRTSIDVQLEASSESLSEIVVTAFGLAKEKRVLVTASQEIKGESFTQARDNNIASALTGRLAGVDATQINSGPGGASRVIIRGNTSLNSNQQPLYVVNGMPIRNDVNGASQGAASFNPDRGDGISMMNPDDIETITVLKGGAAAALYGSQAANGVILITTKSGKAQKGVGIELNSVANYGTPSVYPVFQYEYGQGQKSVKPTTLAMAQATGRYSFGTKMDGSPSLQVDNQMHPYSPQTVKQNIQRFFRPSSDITNTVAFSGGTQALNARLSISDLRSNAQQPNSTFKRQGANLSLTSTMGKNDFITMKGNMQYNIVRGHNRIVPGYAMLNAAWPVYLVANTVDIRTLKGTDPDRPGFSSVTGREMQWNSAPEATNPYFLITQDGNGDETQRFISSASVQVNLTPKLFILTQGAKDFQSYDQFNYESYYSNTAPNNLGSNFTTYGGLSTTNGTRQKSNLQATINYNTSFLKDFNITAMGGGNSERESVFSSSAVGNDFVIPDFISYTNLLRTAPANRYEIRSGTNSLFASADMDYKRIYHISITGRQDWFSTLNPGNNAIFYPSIGANVILSDAIKMPAKIDFVKLRGSWAQVGSATVAAGTVRQTYTLSTVNFYNLPVQGVSATLQNPDLRPLTVTTVEGGIETQLLGNRLGLDVTYYNRITNDDIVSVTISAQSGFSGGNQNIGKVTNKGIEAVISGTPIKTANFSWDLGYNFGWNKSTIVRLAPNVTSLSLGGGIGGTQIVNRPGLPYATVLARRIMVNASGQTVYNKTSNFPISEEVAFGVANPPTIMGLNSSFRYKRFSLNVLLDGKFGAVGYSNLMQYSTRNGLTPMTLEGRETGLQLTGVDQSGAPYSHLWGTSVIDSYYNTLGSTFTGLFVYNTDFVKLRRTILNYNFPVDKLKFAGIQAGSIAFVASDLLILYRDKAVKAAGLDPEFGQSTSNAQGTGGVNPPKTRNIGLSLSLKF